MKMTKMFDKVTCTWNPLGGKCPHECVYCFSFGEKGLVKKFNMDKYGGKPKLYMSEFHRMFKPDDFVFVQDMSDLFADSICDSFIKQVLDHVRAFPKTTFLLLTKNPNRYFEFIIPDNCICGATIETNRHYAVSLAPKPTKRLIAMERLDHNKMLSIEPILDFDFVTFTNWIKLMEPDFVYVGFDNYNYELPEPSLTKTEQLIRELSKFTKVHTKSLRKAWHES